jgi:hypothetical protein
MMGLGFISGVLCTIGVATMATGLWTHGSYGLVGLLPTLIGVGILIDHSR